MNQPDTERTRLLRFMQERNLDHKALGRVMKFSPTFIYGYLGGAWSATAAFKWTFGQTFGFDVAQAIFGNGNGDHTSVDSARRELTPE